MNLVLLPWEIDLDLGTVLAANARAVAGLTPARLEDRLGIEALWGTPPTPARHWPLDKPYRVWKSPSGQYQTEGVSGCDLTYGGIAERSGAALPWAGKPFISGTGISRQESFARRCETELEWNQWVGKAEMKDDRPSVGDGVIVGTGLQTHILMVAGWDGDTAETVEGGQVDPDPDPRGVRGLQCIRAMRRPWRSKPTPAMWSDTRKAWIDVYGWVNTTRLPWRREAIWVPVGFVPSCGWAGE